MIRMESKTFWHTACGRGETEPNTAIRRKNIEHEAKLADLSSTRTEAKCRVTDNIVQEEDRIRLVHEPTFLVGF